MTIIELYKLDNITIWYVIQVHIFTLVIEIDSEIMSIRLIIVVYMIRKCSCCHIISYAVDKWFIVQPTRPCSHDMAYPHQSVYSHLPWGGGGGGGSNDRILDQELFLLSHHKVRCLVYIFVTSPIHYVHVFIICHIHISLCITCIILTFCLLRGRGGGGGGGGW